jgi:2-polyprenyl-3-methyl-5-hydroxy-6-metoxy-1,4-benzoquinol methylase/spore coat polysaccharide biosynthesis predicted glycosyltransferase SpsG
MTLVSDLRALGRETWLFLPTHSGSADNLFSSMSFNPQWRITDDDLPRICANKVECIVLDRFQTPAEEFSKWKEIAPVIAIDEGGLCRDRADFLFDILIPQKLGCPPANIADPFLLKFPMKPALLKKPADGLIKILVSFGQEDSAGLGLAVTRSLSKISNASGFSITYLKGGLGNNEKLAPLPNVRGMQNIPSLAEHLGEYDIVITHYGITAYEALYAGTQVILVPPTAYHEKLAKAAGFLSVRNDPCLQRRLLKIINKMTMLLYADGSAISIENGSFAIEFLPIPNKKNHEGANLATLINSFSPQTNRRCPVCGGKACENSVCRFSGRTYRLCPQCGVIYADRTRPPPENDSSYFFESYKRQYGKTYLEDFTAIKASGKRRLKEIKSLLSAQKDRSLFDIGCAYGPFLAAAREEGFSPTGMDASGATVLYMRKDLDIPAVHGLFPQDIAGDTQYDVVSLWYVIEHFPDCKMALAAIRNILKPGGVLAFSTPSYSGISGRSSLKRFLKSSPEDHLTIWSPAASKKALDLAGFTVKKTVISGHHPERFPLFGRFAKTRKSPLYWPLLAISKIAKLGDTFEAYAQEKI